ncbi:MAG: preprotein translocase subunit SecG, partial [Acidobacteria bacterium]|nr:preprotein translocase subunit SecG [Acidobacteriota bacterium]
LYTLFVLSCIVIVVSILLQPGKADAGALFTNSVSSTAFGPRGTQTLLAKITIIAAAVFMLSALLISVPYFTGARSVLQSVDEQTTPAPTTPAAPPQNAAEPASTTTANETSNATTANANAAPSSNTNAGGANANKQASQNRK